MSDLNIVIEQARPGQVIAPGEAIAGRVTMTSPGGEWETPHNVELVLFWKTSGIGTSDSGMGHSLVLAPKGQRVASHFSRDFTFPAPVFPYSYTGKLIKIDWFLAVEVKLGWRKGAEAIMPIEIRPKQAGGASTHAAAGQPAPLDITYDDRGEPIMKNPF